MRLYMSIVLGWLPLILFAPLLTAPVCTAAPNTDFDWPLRPRPEVVRVFDKPAHDWLPGHRGVDLAGSAGQSVLAAGDGVVAFAGAVAGKHVMSIDHADGVRTTYEPVQGALPLGRRVIRGSTIGTLESGHPGCAASACLHWGARRDHDYIDPLGLLHHTPIRLKPVGTS
ncbi:M23 family metallopeptidase [Nocardia jejuensis]|uniref:M23 family metallopeptidase n=1 Tax=Nocardia jejuensis TaxID=328049 RepID=UPI000A70364F|nr:M23 family metallopeptidase [Nocardia jejuensis]